MMIIIMIILMTTPCFLGLAASPARSDRRSVLPLQPVMMMMMITMMSGCLALCVCLFACLLVVVVVLPFVLGALLSAVEGGVIAAGIIKFGAADRQEVGGHRHA